MYGMWNVFFMSGQMQLHRSRSRLFQVQNRSDSPLTPSSRRTQTGPFVPSNTKARTWSGPSASKQFTTKYFIRFSYDFHLNEKRKMYLEYVDNFDHRTNPFDCLRLERLGWPIIKNWPREKQNKTKTKKNTHKKINKQNTKQPNNNK